jgi:hypothetical protein
LAISGFLVVAVVGQALAADGVVNPLEQINHARVLGLRNATPLGQCAVGHEFGSLPEKADLSDPGSIKGTPSGVPFF